MDCLSAVTSAIDAEAIAGALGYVVGAGSLALYTPILLRVGRSGDASGLTLSTWWLKLASYTCSDVYSFANGYPLSTYLETLIITVEAALVLAVVAAYQRRLGVGPRRVRRHGAFREGTLVVDACCASCGGGCGDDGSGVFWAAPPLPSIVGPRLWGAVLGRCFGARLGR